MALPTTCDGYLQYVAQAGQIAFIESSGVETFCSYFPGCTGSPDGETIFPAACNLQGGVTCAAGKTGCVGSSNNEETNCVIDSYDQDYSFDCSSLAGAACKDSCMLTDEKKLMGTCTGIPVVPPTDAEPTPAQPASCYVSSDKAACVNNAATGSCQWASGSFKSPCGAVTEEGSFCVGCDQYGNLNRPIIKYLQENAGKSWEAKNAAGDGTYMAAVTAWDASACSWYAATDSKDVTEIDVLEFSMLFGKGTSVSIPADRVVTTKELETETGSAAAISISAALTGILLL